MTYKIYPEQDVEDIAEAIRNKNGLTNKYKIGEMADAINNLGIYSLSGEDNAPYLYRKTPLTSDVEQDKIVGGSVVFNQLVEPFNTTVLGVTSVFNSETGVIELSGTSTSTYSSIMNTENVVNGHKYYMKVSAVSNPNNISFTVGFLNGGGTLCSVGSATIKQSLNSVLSNTGLADYAAGTDFTGVKIKAIAVDLTQMFGSTIADYVYQLEQSTAGAGVSYLKSLGYFTDDYYPYNSGEIKSVSGLSSHDMVGFNQWDEEWELGSFNATTGEKVNSNDYVRTKNPIRVVPNTNYYIKAVANGRLFYYDANNNYLGASEAFTDSQIITAPNNCYFMNYRWEGTTYNNDICINISDTNRNGEYEPYIKHSYPLDNTLTLRGIPKLVSNKIQYDGDVYNSDGSVSRKYGVVDLGTLTWIKGTTSFSSTALQSVIKIPIQNTDKPSVIISNGLYKPTSRSADSGVSGSYEFVVYSGQIVYRYPQDGIADATAFKTAMQGVYLIYELAEPTTETAEPYSTIQICDGAGTEEYVTTGIPVGHETKYLEVVEI